MPPLVGSLGEAVDEQQGPTCFLRCGWTVDVIDPYVLCIIDGAEPMLPSVVFDASIIQRRHGGDGVVPNEPQSVWPSTTSTLPRGERKTAAFSLQGVRLRLRSSRPGLLQGLHGFCLSVCLISDGDRAKGTEDDVGHVTPHSVHVASIQTLRSTAWKILPMVPLYIFDPSDPRSGVRLALSHPISIGKYGNFAGKACPLAAKLDLHDKTLPRGPSGSFGVFSLGLILTDISSRLGWVSWLHTCISSRRVLA